MVNPNQKLLELGIDLPKSNPPASNYLPYKIVCEFLYISGQTCRENGEMKFKGQVGEEVSLESGYEAAKLCAVNIISQLNSALQGDLSKVQECVKLNIFVNCKSDFTNHAKVANGASDIIVEIFGEAGRHVRAAVGCISLPGNSAVEIEGVFKVK